MRTHTHPILVIGGGIAGLSTAWMLKERGLDVRVIEKSPLDGGRIASPAEGAGTLETGMQFYYGSYREARRLLKRFGLHDKLRRIDIRGHIFWQGRTAPFSKTKPWLGLLSTKDNLRLQGKVARQLFPLLRMNPFDYRASERLDRIDVVDYFAREGLADDPLLEVAIRPMVNSYNFCEPEGHSLAMLLRIVKLGATAKTYGLECGNDALPRALAAELDVVRGAVTDIIVDKGRVTGVVVDREGKTETLPASCVVSAAGAGHTSRMLRASAPELASSMAEVPHASVVLANLHLDRPLEGREWVYVFSRKAGHQAAFAVDLARRMPTMFEDGRSVIQVDFASPVSDALLDQPDSVVTAAAMADMEAFVPGLTSMVQRTSVVRRPCVMPRFDAGMFGRIRAIETEAAAIEGLQLAGDWLRAPLCEGAVRSAIACADQISRAGVPATVPPTRESVVAAA